MNQQLETEVEIRNTKRSNQEVIVIVGAGHIADEGAPSLQNHSKAAYQLHISLKCSVLFI